MSEERLQKILARAGFGSRRANEALISAGRVKVNNQVAILGTKADPLVDKISVDGSVIKLSAAPCSYIALYKPRMVLSDRLQEDPRRTVFDIIPASDSLFVVGRLDFESEGLMLLTDDGDLANKLTHPRYGHEKEYRVLLARKPDDQQLNAWRRGVVLEDGHRTQPAEVKLETIAGKGAWVRVIMKEGHKRQIREICSQIGLPIVKLIRVRIGTLLQGSLKPGDFRPLTPVEVKNLKSLENSNMKKTVFRPKKIN